MNKVRQIRRKREMTQADLMKESGIYFSTISRIERGYVKPSEKQKERLAQALRVSKNWLFID